MISMLLHHAPTLRSLLVAAALLQAGCASLVSSAASGFADNLSLAVLNQTDPETVRDGAPAYLLLLDSLIEGSPEDPALLAAAADLYASYGAVFADDADRAARLTERAVRYGGKAMCIEYAPSCSWEDMDYETYERSLQGLGEKHADVVLSYAVASLSYIRAHSDDWTSLARLPHMEALLLRYLDVSKGTDDSDAYTYLGILTTLRPPALGGEPEKGRAYFERSIELSGGRDLGAKVEFARGYARLMYDQELHDRLLQDVLAAEAEVPGYTLTNVLAQRDARTLLESGADYF